MTPTKWPELLFQNIPLPLLEVWGSFGYIIGFILMIFAFGGFTFNTGNGFSLGRERQAWDDKTVLSMGISFWLIWFSGFIGSYFVLVPGAQTFESLKDVAVFVCILLFGYPALVVVPFAYGLSDLYEGVPLDFISDWWLGYFINPACFWIAHQLIGKCPDFRKKETWGKYLIFVCIFMAIEPFLWGYICAFKFTTEISYYIITPALFFTTLITWCLAPFVMLAALPIARKLGLYWAEISGHVKQKDWNSKSWTWISGKQENCELPFDPKPGVPIRLFFLAPFIATTLIAMGTTAYIALKGAEQASHRHAEVFHREISENINLKLNNYLSALPETVAFDVLDKELAKLSAGKPGKAFILDRMGKLVASPDLETDSPIIQKSINDLNKKFSSGLSNLKTNFQFKVILQSAKSLSREAWLIQASPYIDIQGKHSDWILMNAMPESYYLEGVREGQSNSALVFAFGLVLVLVVVAILANYVISPIQKLCQAAVALTKGDLTQRVPPSRLAEMNTLSNAFNNMGDQLQKSFDDLVSNENRLVLAIDTGKFGIWDWDIKKNQLYWNDQMYLHYGLKPEKSLNNYETWSKLLVPEEFERVTAEVRAALKGEKEFDTEFKVKWPDGTVHILRSVSKTIRDEMGHAVQMIGVNYDVTERRNTEKELKLYRHQLEDVVAKRTSDLMIKSAQLNELIEKQAKAEVYEKIAQIFLSMRDYTNSPLQVQTIAIGLLKKRCPEQMEIINDLEKSVQSLSNINRILSRLETTFVSTELMSEPEILAYLDNFEQKKLTVD